MDDTPLVTLRIRLVNTAVLGATLRPHEADALYAAWLAGDEDLLIPLADGTELVLEHDEVESIETTAVWPRDIH